MKRLMFICLLIMSSLSYGQENQSFGVQLGSFTAISSDFILKDNLYDAAVGFSQGGSEEFYLHASRLFRTKDKFKIMGQLLNWYYSVGGRYLALDRNREDAGYRLGVRGASGLDFVTSSQKIKLFVEAAGIFNVAPGTNVDMDFLFGGRYYF